MKRFSRSKWAIVFYSALGVLLVGGCGRKESPGSGGAVHDVKVICTRCGATGTLQIAGAPKDATWPKPCPSCKRSGAYASAECKHCGKPAALMDPRTFGYGVPQTCPNCHKAWQPKS